MAGLGLVLPLAVQVDVALVQVHAIAGDADDALDQEHIRIAGLEEDDDVAAVDGAVAHEGRPVRGRRQIDAIDQDVIADEQRVLHGAGGDDEVLKDEGQDEEADDDDGAVGCQGLERSFVVLRGGCCCFAGAASAAKVGGFVVVSAISLCCDSVAIGSAQWTTRRMRSHRAKSISRSSTLLPSLPPGSGAGIGCRGLKSESLQRTMCRVLRQRVWSKKWSSTRARTAACDRPCWDVLVVVLRRVE